jgi:hypothetical protein
MHCCRSETHLRHRPDQFGVLLGMKSVSTALPKKCLTNSADRKPNQSICSGHHVDGGRDGRLTVACLNTCDHADQTMLRQPRVCGTGFIMEVVAVSLRAIRTCENCHLAATLDTTLQLRVVDKCKADATAWLDPT